MLVSSSNARRLAGTLSAIAVLGAALAAGASTPSVPLPPPQNQRLAHDIFKELIEIESIHSRGTLETARVIERRARAAGFAAADVQVLAPKQFPHEANVVIRLHGKGHGNPVLYICHMDVVPANPADWSLPPFKLTEQGGYYYGRGTSDMKNSDASVLATLIRLKQEGFVPDRDIIVAFTADEEVGLDEDGVAFLVREHRDLVDAAMVINPDGGSGAIQHGKRIYFGVETSQKVYVTFTLEATNKGGHSSEPRPDNAIYQLAAGLVKFSHYEFPVLMNATTRSYFAHMATLQTGQIKADMLAVSRQPADLAAARRLSRNTAYNAMLHTTCVATQLSGGHAENALPQRARAIIQCRLIPSDTKENVQRLIQRAIEDPGIHISLTNRVVSGPEAPPTPAIMGAVEKIVNQMWPGVMVMPVMSAGASDSLYTTSAGIPSYGISGAFGDIDDSRAHGRDERTSVAGFYEGLEFTYRLMKELSRTP